MGVEFDLREKVYLDTNLLLDYATVEDGGAFSPLEKTLKSRNCERYISFLSEFEMLSVLRRKRFKLILWDRVKTILIDPETGRIDISEPLVQWVLNVMKQYTHILYNVVKNRLKPPDEEKIGEEIPSAQDKIKEKIPERIDLYHYAIALHRNLDSLASKDRQFCNKPTETGIKETLERVPALKLPDYPDLKCISEKEPEPKRESLKPEELEELDKIERELGIHIDRRGIKL